MRQKIGEFFFWDTWNIENYSILIIRQNSVDIETKTGESIGILVGDSCALKMYSSVGGRMENKHMSNQ